MSFTVSFNGLDFKVSRITENGQPHYSILNIRTGEVESCDLNELYEVFKEVGNV